MLHETLGANDSEMLSHHRLQPQPLPPTVFFSVRRNSSFFKSPRSLYVPNVAVSDTDNTGTCLSIGYLGPYNPEDIPLPLACRLVEVVVMNNARKVFATIWRELWVGGQEYFARRILVELQRISAVLECYEDRKRMC